jgi:hypothetical protein
MTEMYIVSQTCASAGGRGRCVGVSVCRTAVERAVSTPTLTCLQLRHSCVRVFVCAIVVLEFLCQFLLAKPVLNNGRCIFTYSEVVA